MPQNAFMNMQILVFGTVLVSLIPILVSKQKVLRQRWFTWLVIAVIYAGSIWLDRLATSLGWPVHALTGLVWLVAAIAIQVETNRLASHHENRSLFFLLLFTTLNWLACISLWRLDWIGFIVFFAVAAFDIAGWVGGKLSHRLNLRFMLRQLAPKTSPNKTIGGLLLGVLVSGLALVLAGVPNFALWLIIVLLAPVGDWLESAFKRKIGVKDAGTWLPGFGGLLDRFDSILLVAPVVLVSLTFA